MCLRTENKALYAREIAGVPLINVGGSDETIDKVMNKRKI